MKDDFQANGQILGHGKLGEVMEKVMESHGISKAQRVRTLVQNIGLCTWEW